jgi:hypothetical protein
MHYIAIGGLMRSRTEDVLKTLTAIREYDRIAAPELISGRDYERTLSARPWQECPCTICRGIGVEVIIRGNNRNRRRGFHNTWQLYQQLHSVQHRDVSSLHSAIQLGFTV